jgi:hypothetical protein
MLMSENLAPNKAKKSIRRYKRKTKQKEKQMSEDKATGLDASYGDWDSDYSEKKENNSGAKSALWMKFDKPGEYVIRLVGKYVTYHRHWKPFSERVLTHPEYKSEDPAWKAGFIPRKGHAIHIIDRSDGQVKIMDKSNAFFRHFHDFKKFNDIDPASRDEAPDFVVQVTWPNGNKRQAKYNVVAKQKAAPLTEAEMANLSENKFDLKAIYKSTPLEKIKELWNNLPKEARIPKKENDISENEKSNKKFEQYTAPTSSAVEDDTEGEASDFDF